MVNNKRVVRDDKFIILKAFDGLTQDTIFKGKALMSDKKQVKKMLDEAEAKGIFLR